MQRRKSRRLAELGVQPRLVSDPGEIEPALRRLLDLRHRRAIEQGQRHAHLDARFERFLLEAVRGMLPEGVRLWTLELDGRTLASRLNFVQGPREHSYLLGLGDEHANLSPGSTLERHAIYQAIAEGCTELDLGPGRDEYKYRLGAIERALARLVVVSRSVRGRIAGTSAAIDLRLRDPLQRTCSGAGSPGVRAKQSDHRAAARNSAKRADSASSVHPRARFRAASTSR